MPTYYTVVQCVPDPIANERINVGVIVFGDGQIRSRFVRNWDRVARFAQEDVGYVREFAEWIEQAGLASAAGSLQEAIPGFPVPRRLDGTALREVARDWSNSIQLTPPQPSLEAPDALLANLVETFLREPRRPPVRFRDRQAAAQLAVKTVRRAVEDRLGATAAEQIVRAPYQLGGKVMPRLRVDLAVKNGRLYVASRALSFETPEMSELDRQSRDAVYTLRDVGDLLGQVRLDVLVLPPRKEMRGFVQAEERFRELLVACRQINARVIPEGEAQAWATEIANLAETEIMTSGRTLAGR